MTSNSAWFGYVQSPSSALSLSSISPEAGWVGSRVILSGSGLTAVEGVSFGDVWAEAWTVDDDSQITVTVPEPITSGSVWVSVSSLDATSESVSFAYEE